YYEVAARQGFFWWEIDITFYGLKFLSWLGLIHDLKGVPNHIKYSKNKTQAKELAGQLKRNEISLSQLKKSA
ncbi:MAG: acyl-CoA desaturase, partial [Bacteroidota bacterium]